MATKSMIPDDFLFEATLGVGAFSKVVAAKYKPDGQRYAVKMIPKRLILSSPTDEERQKLLDVARREMKMLLMCNHPNIIRFYASMQSNEELMYVTEMCEGGELLDVIKRRGSIPLAAARHIIAEILSAVNYLHSAPKMVLPIGKGGVEMRPSTILHRDIKPENIMMTEHRHVKLIDFGTAVICDANTTSSALNPNTNLQLGGRAATFCGTTQYMSPELLQDNYTCVPSDYWGIGCILYHCLVGRRPFDAPTQYLLIKSILEQDVVYPPEMDAAARDLISRLLVKDPAGRLGSAEMGGFDAVMRHPFFNGVDWETLHSTDVSGLWQKEFKWVKDSEVVCCRACEKDFSILRRKHHCRSCGDIFCKDCSSRQALIPESQYRNPERVCDSCYEKIMR